MAMQAESLEVLESAAVPPAQARAIVRAIEFEIAGAKDMLATKHDIVLLRAETVELIANLRSELKADIGALRSELKAEIAEVRTSRDRERAPCTSTVQTPREKPGRENRSRSSRRYTAAPCTPCGRRRGGSAAPART